MNQHRRDVYLLAIALAAFALLRHAFAQTATPPPAAQQSQPVPCSCSDWAMLSRYRLRNAALASTPASKRRYVLLGDSITDFWYRDEVSFFADGTFVDRGIYGQTAPQMILRFRQDVIGLKPNVVVILAGINDLAGNTGPETVPEIEGYLTSLIELARANSIRVVLASLLPVTDSYRSETIKHPPAQIRQINTWEEAYCKANGCTYLDYFHAMADETGAMRKELTVDGLHPNVAGYHVMEPLVRRAVAEAMQKR